MRSDEYPRIRFADLLSEPLRNGVYKSKEYHGRGAKVVNMGELFGYPRLRDVPMKRVELTDAEVRKSSLRRGDLLFARRSLVAEGAGRCSVVKEVGELTTFESSIIRARLDCQKADSDFVYYYFASPQGRELMRTILRQVAVSGIAGSDLAELTIPVPPIAVQRQCARTLEQIDDRIDLLRQTNATIESIAQALFKSWFVDFDPVRAKAEGREPEGMDAETAALFPSEFEESELGKIPKGWRVGCLGDILIQRVERAKPSILTAGLPYVPIECISPKSVFLCESLPGEQAQSSLTFFKKDDVLFGAMRPYFHKVCIAPFDGVTRTTVFVLQAKKGHMAFALFAAFDDSTVEFATTHSEGSTIPYAKWTSSLERKRTIIPPATIAAQFESLVTPLLESGMHNTTRSSLLTDLRDTLLPRLISGKLRITEAMEQVEEALT